MDTNDQEPISAFYIKIKVKNISFVTLGKLIFFV